MIPYHETYISPNRWSSRRGYKIVAAGVHITGGEMPGLHSWIMNPNAQASYNCVVKRDGKRISYVPEEYPAFGHGKINRGTWPLLAQYSGVNPNWYTLSVSRVGTDPNFWTPEQMESIIEILQYWSNKYGFPLKRPYVFGHFEIDSVDRPNCPGRRFFDALIEELDKGKGGKRSPMNFVLINTDDDYVCAKRVLRTLPEQGAVVHRESPRILKESQEQDRLIVMGGNVDGIDTGKAKVELWSGDTWWLTMQNAGKKIGALK